MKIVDAQWEFRNIGVSCHEIYIESMDTESELTRLEALQSDYLVVKLPVSKSSMIFPIQRLGYDFVELVYQARHKLVLPVLSKPLTRMLNSSFVIEASDELVKLVSDSIVSGMFSTDRVAMDSRFGSDLSAKRYREWLNDLIVSGASVFVLHWKGEPVGFYVIKHDGSTCEALLGGVFDNISHPSLGCLLNYFEIITARSLGCERLIGRFSSNNSPVFKINTMLGYEIHPEHYVFVRHSK